MRARRKCPECGAALGFLTLLAKSNPFDIHCPSCGKHLVSPGARKRWLFIGGILGFLTVFLGINNDIHFERLIAEAIIGAVLLKVVVTIDAAYAEFRAAPEQL